MHGVAVNCSTISLPSARRADLSPAVATNSRGRVHREVVMVTLNERDLRRRQDPDSHYYSGVERPEEASEVRRSSVTPRRTYRCDFRIDDGAEGLWLARIRVYSYSTSKCLTVEFNEEFCVARTGMTSEQELEQWQTT